MDSKREQDEGTLSILDFCKLMLGKWRLFVIVTASATIAAALFAFLVTPIYRSEILLAPSSSKETVGGLASLASQFGGAASLAGLTLNSGDEQGNRSFAVLTSRQFSEMFIERHNLIPILFSSKWDEDAGSWEPQFSEDPPGMAEAVQLFDRRVRSVSKDNSTGFVLVVIEWRNPEVAAEWANNLVAMLNNYLRKKDIAEAEKSIEYLKKEFDKTSVKELRLAISSIIEQQIQSAMIANVRDEYAFDILDPAVASELDDPVRPKKLLVIFTGILLGMIMSIVIILVLSQEDRAVARSRPM